MKRSIPAAQPIRRTLATAVATGWVALVPACSPAQPRPESAREAGEGARSQASRPASPPVVTLCNPVLCLDTATISVVVPIPAQALANAPAHLTIGGERLELSGPRPVDKIPRASRVWRLPSFTLDQIVRSLGPSLSQLEISVRLPPELTQDEVVYAVTIESPQGGVFNVSRTMQSRKSKEPSACGEPCVDVAMRLYPNSRSGIVCGGASCDSGLVLEAVAPAPAASIDNVELCRNSTCARLDTYGRPGVELMGEVNRYWFSPPLDTSYFDFSASSSAMVFHALADPVALADGDKYAVTFLSGSRVVGTRVVVACYETWYPNGPECDTLPCKRMVVQHQ